MTMPYEQAHREMLAFVRLVASWRIRSWAVTDIEVLRAAAQVLLDGMGLLEVNHHVPTEAESCQEAELLQQIRKTLTSANKEQR